MQPKDLILNNGLEVPKLAYGTYLVEDKDIIKEAIKIGYRHIDGADVYGNQIVVGKAINECINEGVVKREDLFITSKVCHTKFGWQRVQDCCKNSLKEMIEANFLADKIEIPKEEMKKLDTLDGGAFSNWHLDCEPQKLIPLSAIPQLLQPKTQAKTSRYYLFGLPILKVKDNGKGRTKYYLFGIPLVKKKVR